MNQFLQIFNKEKDFFNTGITHEYVWRINALKKLRKVFIMYQDEFCKAAYKDFKRVPQEVLGGEIWYLIKEIDFTLKNLKQWCKAERVTSPFFYFPSIYTIQSSAYGVVLIISPWNFPYLLTFGPLIHALAAGNCAIIKPSELSAHQSALIAQIIAELFDEGYVRVIEGDKYVVQELLQLPFDYIFFTGSTYVGQYIYQKAAEHIIPITLELGGKSPAVVLRDADINKTAEKIIFGKYINAGQTCIAVDYVMVADDIKKDLISALKEVLLKFYGKMPVQNCAYSRIVNHAHFERLTKLLHDQDIIVGGDVHEKELYIAPTLIKIVDFNNLLMKEEIFGPLLPILSYTQELIMIDEIKKLPPPLALYVFGKNDYEIKKIIQSIPSGGVCINGVFLQAHHHKLPFGGIGASGFGRYHGKDGFNTFSYKRSIVYDHSWWVRFLYPPYKSLLIKLVRWWYKN